MLFTELFFLFRLACIRIALPCQRTVAGPCGTSSCCRLRRWTRGWCRGWCRPSGTSCTCHSGCRPWQRSGSCSLWPPQARLQTRGGGTGQEKGMKTVAQRQHGRRFWQVFPPRLQWQFNAFTGRTEGDELKEIHTLQPHCAESELSSEPNVSRWKWAGKMWEYNEKNHMIAKQKQ